MSKKQDKTEVETTGHSWDGIEEYNNPLPRWWLWTFYLCIVWAIGYSIAYPAWPLVKGATTGLLGYSTRAEVAKDIQTFDEMNAAIDAELAAANVADILPNTPLGDYATNAGAAVFRANCSQCHGSGAAGNVGYPNLLDNDWLWGGSVDEIAYSIQHGIRNETDDARYSEMPRFGVDEILEPEQIDQVVEFVLQLSGSEFDAALATEGAVVFEENCAACHAEDGTGDRDFGAPNLADAIWLYGGDRETIHESVSEARFGVMPAWGQRLTQAEVNAAAVYVHTRGGGE
ncbi:MULTISPECIES: cytochrome-c oxidase, cbb3-type subunit III [Pacificibacter]|uniref:cytochrome-c oxidase, cbb3-type subunit III n=1 Tax=Pacificibacter TaxID=1042323 RepID=UPI001C083563|nr:MULTISPECIES: cytochrome-c oxidase, cbb3-type subunit III [Pacificibacter]MBU2937833.1 cytochrome-c oxidase, cbb3-type subunit III [Pacificibacter marinus]MDO6616094.1 cytochrome-c oxidase, cbb3-type subunit III [Pacificibacter sp. 1_MG-2023]